ncbi:Arginyl-tRNA synthetase [hydrothermal vent metagenome]|uniref:arginine--tRNA ligase n=1 Tax=hydrothermal vent metagenome TaxID=652676 RepID=A0A3B0S3U7_9ZZZZ
MQSILEQLSLVVGEAFADLSLPAELGRVQHSVRAGAAPFQCNGCMAAAKIAKTNPRELAGKIAAALGDQPLLASVEVAGPGFLNLVPADAALQVRANQLAADQRTGAVPTKQPNKIVIDFGGPNVAKPMHVGHLRSSVIGDCLQRLLRFVGHEVISDIHLGDWGLQMGQLITQLQIEQPQLIYFNTTATGPWPTEPPVAIDDLSRMYPVASLACKEDETRMQQARTATAELQAGNAGYRALLEHFIAVSVAALRQDFDALGVHFDLWKGEAAVDPLIGPMIEQFKKDGYTEHSQGALIIRVAKADDKKELPPLILVSSAGAVLYATTDLATILDRKDNLQPDVILYVVDTGQSSHFEQVFRAAGKTGLFAENALEHIKFGTVNGKDGKRFRTRAGGVMRLSDLLGQAKDAAAKRLADAGLAKDMDKAERAQIARMIGLAAIKFADLGNVRTTNYVFDMERFTSFEGKTGPYLLYAAVRMKSILAKAAKAGIEAGEVLPQMAEEKALVLVLDDFDRALRGAASKRYPHILCEHLYDLAQGFSKFYASCPVLGADTPAMQASRLALVATSLRQLETGLDLLGIKTPQRM